MTDSTAKSRAEEGATMRQRAKELAAQESAAGKVLVRKAVGSA